MNIGILGGGQLGRMLLQAAANYDVITFLLENDAACPAAHLCHHFELGDIQDFNTVLSFGRKVDVLTVEIEQVNIEALFQLEKEGVKVIPNPSAIATIKDKGLQKIFYETHGIPTSEFRLIESKTALSDHLAFLPLAQKLRTGGYDGKGVEILKSESDFSNAFDAPSVLEKLVDIEKELSVIVAVGIDGEWVSYEPCEMVFDPQLNLVDYLLAPAAISLEIANESKIIAAQAVLKLASAGLFAVELFLTPKGELIVNEIAPRAHNSGHATIEANTISQYDMQLRIFQSLPLGVPRYHHLCCMWNLIGEKGSTGAVEYQGLSTALAIDGVYTHLYGKTITKPGRKMGHITLIDASKESLLAKLDTVKRHVRVSSYKVDAL